MVYRSFTLKTRVWYIIFPFEVPFMLQFYDTSYLFNRKLELFVFVGTRSKRSEDGTLAPWSI